MTTQIRYVRAGDLTTAQVQALVWNGYGTSCERFQELAIVDDRVIGSWKYVLERRRGTWRIDSSYTEVMPRYRKKGVARSLWFSGIRRWEPSRISSMIGSDEGRTFLARMQAELAYYRPELMLWVKRRPEDQDTWDSHCEWAARKVLRKLGEQARAAKQVEAKPLKLLKGAEVGRV